MFDIKNISPENPVIAWWSGGITSSIACWLCIKYFGKESVRVVMINAANNEDNDTYRFKSDCEKWWGVNIETIQHKSFQSIEEVWRKYKSLNVANGAICSSTLKREVRQLFQVSVKYSYQAFGFDVDEIRRAKAMKLNYPESRPIFPLVYELLSKKECIKIAQEHGVKPPKTYHLGFHNNNCFKTGCVQGGIGYWQLMGRKFPEKFDKMADLEHELTNLKGSPVTMLKDQSKNGGLVFLKPHPDYPHIKDISMMKGREPKPLMECNGFCGINDLSDMNETANEINYQ